MKANTGNFQCDLCKTAFYQDHDKSKSYVFRWKFERDYVLHRKKIHGLETIGWEVVETRLEKEVHRY